MKRVAIHTIQTRLLLTAGALFAVCLTTTTPALAQTDNESGQLMGRINQLENQVQTLSRAIFRGDKSAAASMAAPAPAATPASLATFDTRMSQLEDQQRNLTGQLEKINFTLQQLKDRLDRMQADTEQRFQQTGANNTAPTVLTPPRAAVEQTAPPVTAPSTAGGTLGTLHSSGGSNGSAEALYEAAFANIRDTKYDEAEAGFKQFLSQYPGHPLVSNAQYWLGETYYVRGNFKEAAKIFAQDYQNFPQGPKAEDSLLKLGLSLSKLGKKDDACLSLRQLQKEAHDNTSPLLLKAGQEIKSLGCP